MLCRKCSTVVPVPPAPSAPAWADPRTMMQVSAWRSSQVQSQSGQAFQLIGADPKRVGVGFSVKFSRVPLSVHPDPLSAQLGWSTVMNGASAVWFDLLTFGPLVTAEWWGWTTVVGLVVVTEVYRLQ